MKYKTILLVDYFILLFGVVLVLFGFLFEIDKEGTILGLEKSTAQNVIISVGCSIIASAIVSLVMTVYMNDNKRARRVVDEWGISSVDIRSILNIDINNKLDSMDHGMDIIALGLKNFRSTKGKLIEQKVRKGCVVRILTINPTSTFLKQREIEEGEPENQISNSIVEMIAWAKDISDNQKNRGKIEVRVYDGLPQDTYQRVDGYVYIGPLFYMVPSQQTIAFEFKPGSKGAIYYNDYFKTLWEDAEFTKKVV